MKPNSIRSRLRAGEVTIATRLFLTDPLLVETIGHTGAFDYVEFLAEYAAFDLRGLDDFCRAAELHSLGTMIKVDFENSRFNSQRAVGSGFESVLFTDARSPDDVRAFFASITPDTPGAGGLYGAAARRNTLPTSGGTPADVSAIADVVKAVMIEKISAVESLEAILAVPGIDMVQWGPTDYGMSVGQPGERERPDIRAVERRVIETCHAAGVPCRAEISTVEAAKYYADLGVRHFSLGTDLRTLYVALKDGAERLRTAIVDAT